MGHFVTKKLLDLGHDVTVLDNLTYGSKGLDGLTGRERFNFILGDIGDLKSVVKAAKGKDAVVALAAIVGDPACALNEDETIQTNFLATRILADVCNHYGIGRIVFASSCSVYGDTKNDIADERSPVNPLSLYAETRIMSEKLLLERRHKFSTVILRLATVFGYSKRMRFDLVVNFLAAKAFYQNRFTIRGGNQWRPFVHVQDAAEAFVRAALAPKRKVDRKIINVGNDKNNLSISAVGAIVKKLFKKVSIEKRRELEDKRNYRISFGRLGKILDFECRYSVADGVKELIEKMKAEKIENFEDDVYYNVRYIYKIRNGQ